MQPNEILKILKLYGKVEVGNVSNGSNYDKYRVRLIDSAGKVWCWDESSDLSEAFWGVFHGIEGNMICVIQDIEESD
jgi:hypothetical protein